MVLETKLKGVKYPLGDSLKYNDICTVNGLYTFFPLCRRAGKRLKNVAEAKELKYYLMKNAGTA